MKTPTLLVLTFCFAAVPVFAASSEVQQDARERAQRRARLHATDNHVRQDFQEAGRAIRRDAQKAGSKLELAWAKLEAATVHAAENVADAIGVIRSAAVAEAKETGHHLQGGFAKSQRHLDVVRLGNSVSIVHCDSPLLNGPAHFGLGKGDNCQVLQNGSMKIADVKACARQDSEMPGAQPLARQLDSMDTKRAVEHSYFLTYNAEPSDFKVLLRRCQERLAAAHQAKKRALASPRKAEPALEATEQPRLEFKPVDHSRDQSPDSVDATIGG